MKDGKRFESKSISYLTSLIVRVRVVAKKDCCW